MSVYHPYTLLTVDEAYDE